MGIYSSDFAVEQKDDSSPVTEADKRAETIILRELEKAAPEIPVVSEEAAAERKIPDVDDIFFLVDPLDGTKEFINRNDEFTVNIALIEGGAPVLGVVYAPALSRMFYSLGPGLAFEQSVEPKADNGALQASEPRAIQVREHPIKGLTAVASRSHRSPETDDYLRAFNVADFVSAGSSLKFCLVAAGEADIYPRHGPTMEWDTAAGHAVLIGAGGEVLNFDGAPFVYGKTQTGFKNPYFVAFAGDLVEAQA